jgi:hypothetical protein
MKDDTGSRDLPIRQFFVDNLRVLAAMTKNPVFWRIFAIATVGWLIAMIVCWKWDMTGWRRDLLRSLPILGTLPWLVSLRKRHLAVRLCRQNHRPG